MPFLPTVRAAQGDPRNINVWERDPSKPQNLENALYGVVNPPLLRTPISSEAEGGAMHPEDAKAGGNNLKLGWQILGHFGHIEPKLPTPLVSDGTGGPTPQQSNFGLQMRDVARLLPTPNTMEHREIKTPEQIAELKKRSPGGYRNLRESVVNDLVGTPRTSSANGSSSKQVANGAKKSRIEDQVLTISWGKFEPAIYRWEQVIDRPAPAPTKPDGKDGQHRLSSEFTEWLMGLPEGWVTDPKLGLTRNEQLKLCGNGVVPQQAALALTRLLTGIDLNKEEQK